MIVYQVPPPVEPPSAWVQELERDAPAIISDVVVIADPLHPEDDPAYRAHIARLERQFGPLTCTQRIEGYSGRNPIWLALFGEDLYRECGYVLRLTPSEERPRSVDQVSGYHQPLPEE